MHDLIFVFRQQNFKVITDFKEIIIVFQQFRMNFKITGVFHDPNSNNNDIISFCLSSS